MILIKSRATTFSALAAPMSRAARFFWTPTDHVPIALNAMTMALTDKDETRPHKVDASHGKRSDPKNCHGVLSTNNKPIYDPVEAC